MSTLERMFDDEYNNRRAAGQEQDDPSRSTTVPAGGVPRPGDRRSCPLDDDDDDKAEDGAEYACFEVGGRASLFVNRRGTVRSLYHDTGRWSRPRASRCVTTSGAVVCGRRGTRLLKALKDAWTSPDRRRLGRAAQLVDPAAGLHVDNVAYRACHRARPCRTKDMSDCVHRALSAACSVDTMEELCAACDVTRSTALTYLCRGLSAVGACFPADKFVDPDLLAAVEATHDVTGSLRHVQERLPDEVRDTWTLRRDAYAQLRLARSWVEALRREDGHTFTD